MRMKKLILSVAIILTAGIISETSAQARATSNKEIQPAWAPSGHEYLEYIYLPEISTYYYVPRKQFIYQSDGYWTFSSRLPKSHRGYNLGKAEKVVINEPGAYRYYAEHKEKYSGNPTSAVAVE